MEDEEDRQLITGSPSQSLLERKQQAAKKKKFLFWGIGILLFAIVLTLILVFALKGGDKPGPNIDHFNPYKVLEYDSKTNTYTLGRETNLKFQYPFNETYNNKLLNTFKLQGSNNFTDKSTYKFKFFAGGSKSEESFLSDEVSDP